MPSIENTIEQQYGCTFTQTQCDSVKTHKHRHRVDFYCLSDTFVLDGNMDEWRLLLRLSSGASRNETMYVFDPTLVRGKQKKTPEGCIYEDSIPFLGDRLSVESLARSFASAHRIAEAEALFSNARELFSKEILEARTEMRDTAYEKLNQCINDLPELALGYVHSYTAEKGENAYSHQKMLAKKRITLASVSQEKTIHAALYVLYITETPNIEERVHNLTTPEDQRTLCNDFHTLRLRPDGLWELRDKTLYGPSAEYASRVEAETAAGLKPLMPEKAYKERTLKSFQELQQQYPEPILLEKDDKFYAAKPSPDNGQLMVHGITTKQFVQPPGRLGLYELHMFPKDKDLYPSVNALEGAGYKPAVPPEMPRLDEFENNIPFSIANKNGRVEIHYGVTVYGALIAHFPDMESAEKAGWITPERARELEKQEQQKTQQAQAQEQEEQAPAANQQATEEAKRPPEAYCLPDQLVSGVHWGIQENEALINHNDVLTWARTGAKALNETLPNRNNDAYGRAVVIAAAAALLSFKYTQDDRRPEILKAEAQGWVAALIGQEEYTLPGGSTSECTTDEEEEASIEGYLRGLEWRPYYPHLSEAMQYFVRQP